MRTSLGPLMRRTMGGISFAVASIALAPASGADAANFGTLSREPTPLVLKDGRIAKVSVHIVPFETGSAELSSTDRSSLMRTLVPMATDCFLTAQAVGHVEQTDGAEDDTMATHRLARARAEHIQQEMIELGLPSASIASVWDWQFLVRDARVTLWVFQLIRGEECEGRQLEEARLVAASLPKTDPLPQQSPQVVEDPEPANEPGPAVATVSEPEAEPTIVEDPRQSALTPGDGSSEPLEDPETSQTAIAATSAAVDEAVEPAVVNEPPEDVIGDTVEEPSSETEVPDVREVDGELTVAAQTEEAPFADEAAEEIVDQDTLLKLKPPAEPEVVSPIDEAEETAVSDFEPPAEPPVAELTEATTVGADAAVETAGEAVTPDSNATAPVTSAPVVDAVVEEPEAQVDEMGEAPTPTIIVDTSEEPAAGPLVSAALAENEPALPSETLTTEVTFAVNSSYMNGDDHQTLRSFLDDLPAPGAYRFVLTAAVGAGDVEASDPEEDKRYNQWMAERRIERVQTFLESNSGNREVTFEPGFAADDNSREVRLKIVPQG